MAQQKSLGDLLARNVDFHADLLRNIPGIRRSQNLYDDLSSDPADWEIAAAAEGEQRIPTAAAIVSRPFDYGSVITFNFDTAHWHATRFSDGRHYGVWYGSQDVKTTVYETVAHWYRFLTDSFPVEDRSVITERRVLDVRCDALLVDVRRQASRFPALVDRNNYAFCQQLGSYLRAQGQSGLLAPSARCDGINAALFTPDRLSNPRDKLFLTYRCNPALDRCTVERQPDMTWLKIRPSELL